MKSKIEFGNWILELKIKIENGIQNVIKNKIGTFFKIIFIRVFKKKGISGALKYLASTFYLFMKKDFCALYYYWIYRVMLWFLNNLSMFIKKNRFFTSHNYVLPTAIALD